MKKSRGITALILTVLTVYAILALMRARSDLRDANEMTAQLQVEIEAVSAENEELMRRIESSGSDSAIERIARERLGLVMPDEIVFTDIN